MALVLVALPTSIAVAVVRFQLYELRALVNRSALLLLTGVILAAVYLGVLILLAAAVGDRTPLTVSGVLAAGAVVAISAPVAAVATRMTRRWFGRGRRPASMVTRFAEELLDRRRSLGHRASPGRDDPCGVAARFDRVGHRRARRHEDRRAERTGQRTSTCATGERHVGELLVTARQGQSLGAVDVRMLREIAGYVSIAAEAIRVGEDLRRAQHELVTAQSEERRRVRRDLHDDVGPTLASARLKLAAHRRQLPEGTSVDDIIDQLADAIRGIRRVVDGLQPSVLEDVGLVSALQILLTDLRQTTGIHIIFDAPCSPSRSTRSNGQHGLSSCRRGAHQCRAPQPDRRCAPFASLMMAEMLHIEVADNGIGFDTSMPTGMGLRNMLNRAGLANGVATISSSPDSGTTVVLDVPL